MRSLSQQKAALTTAVKSGNRDRLVQECLRTIKEWNENGYWPDDWSRWQRALDDAFPVFEQPRLQDLEEEAFEAAYWDHVNARIDQGRGK